METRNVRALLIGPFTPDSLYSTLVGSFVPILFERLIGYVIAFLKPIAPKCQICRIRPGKKLRQSGSIQKNNNNAYSKRKLRQRCALDIEPIAFATFTGRNIEPEEVCCKDDSTRITLVIIERREDNFLKV